MTMTDHVAGIPKVGSRGGLSLPPASVVRESSARMPSQLKPAYEPAASQLQRSSSNQRAVAVGGCTERM